ncbi:MAG: hypothetical protein RMZ42_16845 [Nostoc sp. DedQUE05]|uniref:hypothetical protein n=1 Tax=Nostoc sp. DedQUE05 TaxID=3075391 RepID=UPI002AD4C2BE|nr:hypothetical protein [Nostoc sp. DedQUE05]MDZ8093578.1 hypothetical protein [Nostoc sp. DedQUE05]
MKINRHGRARVLTQQEIQLIFSDGLNNGRDAYGGLRLRALFGVCLFSPVESVNAVRDKLKISTHPRVTLDRSLSSESQTLTLGMIIILIACIFYFLEVPYFNLMLLKVGYSCLLTPAPAKTAFYPLL